MSAKNFPVGSFAKTRGHFPRDDAATKLLWLALRNIGQGNSIRDWREAMNQFAIAYRDRFTAESLDLQAYVAYKSPTIKLPAVNSTSANQT
jgi:hypothetical protein